MKYPNFNEEKKFWKKGYKYVAGLDEVGRGPLAGPVVAGAVLLKLKIKSHLIPQNYSERKRAVLKLKLFNKIKDSKKMTPKAREEVYEFFKNHQDIKWGIGIVSEKIIDKINILEATKLAMKKAICDANIRMHANNTNKKIGYLLIDGNFSLDTNLPQKSIVKADQKVFSCALASIFAKVTRDRLMQKYHKKYPQYGFDKHKGYPTKAHFANLRKFGSCKIHRKSFYPVNQS